MATLVTVSVEYATTDSQFLLISVVCWMRLWGQGARMIFCSARLGASTFWSSYGLLESALRKSLYWSPWFGTLAAEISGHNSALFLVTGSNERDDPQDRGTHDRGTAASYYGCCCRRLLQEHPEMIHLV
jgi:hypothetical protein